MNRIDYSKHLAPFLLEGCGAPTRELHSIRDSGPEKSEIPLPTFRLLCVELFNTATLAAIIARCAPKMAGAIPEGKQVTPR